MSKGKSKISTVKFVLFMADPTSNAVLTVHDSSKDRKTNIKVEGGSKYSAGVLDTCAEILDIPVKYKTVQECSQISHPLL